MLDANSQYGARRSKEEKEDTTLRLRVSAVIFFHATCPDRFGKSRKGRMLIMLYSKINFRGKGKFWASKSKEEK